MILLGMYDVYVILGMDWLSIHSASIGYFTKKIVFRKSRYPKLEFFADRRILPTCVISILEAKKLLHKGCEDYLAHVVDKSSSKVTLDSVPVVREFSNVFLEYLPGLLPDRELEFRIKLLPGSVLISIPPYKMVSTELK